MLTGDNLDSVLTLIQNNVSSIIHRPANKNNKDDEGHYVVAYNYYDSEKMISIFDPRYNGKRPEGIISHPGTHGIESFGEFKKNWRFQVTKFNEKEIELIKN